MSCQSVRKLLSAYVDDRLPTADRAWVSAHLAQCCECGGIVEEYTGVRTGLRRLPSIAVPRELATQLQVLASRERVRQQVYSSWSRILEHWQGRMRLVVDNLMRPLALPFAGGLLSALCMFSMLVPSLQFFPGPLSTAPTALYTEATVASASPFGVSNDILVELVINEEGRIVDYTVRDREVNRELITQLGNMILFTTFNPATSFGQPTAGRLLVSFRRSQINVKG